MARIAWLCPLVLRGDTWEPKICGFQRQATGFFPAVWTTTDAIRQGKWALGMAEVTPAQQAAIDTDNTIHTFNLANERFQRFQDLPAGRRNRVNTFLQALGIERPLRHGSH